MFPLCRFYRATGDLAWLSATAMPILRAVAQWLLSRVTFNQTGHSQPVRRPVSACLCLPCIVIHSSARAREVGEVGMI